MRKGIEKIINVLDPEADVLFIEWLANTDLSLKYVDAIFKYYWILNNGEIAPGLIVDEINKYAYEYSHDNAWYLLHWYNGTDPLLGNEKAKREIQEYFINFDEDTASFYRIMRMANIEPVDRIMQLRSELDNPIKQLTLEKCVLATVNESENTFYSLLGKDFIANMQQSALWYIFTEKNADTIWFAPVLNQVCDKIINIKKFIDTNGCFEDRMNSSYEIISRVHGLDKFFNSRPGELNVKVHGISFDVSNIELNNILIDKKADAIRKFAGNNLKFTFGYSQVSMNYDIDSYDKEKVDAMLKASAGDSFVLSTPFHHLSIQYNIDGRLNITALSYRKLYACIENDENKVNGYGKASACDLFITPDNNVFMKSDVRKRFVPASVKMIYKKTYDHDDFKRLINIFANELDLYFLKDILKDFKEAHCITCPITIQEALTFKNRKEYILHKFPLAKKLHVDFNKININLAYALCKSLRYIHEKDYGKLGSFRDNEKFLASIYNSYNTFEIETNKKVFKASETPRVLLSNYLINEFGLNDTETTKFQINPYLDEDEYEDFLVLIENTDGKEIRDKLEAIQLIIDYVNMCFKVRRKVEISHSLKRVIEEHNHFMDKAQLKEYFRCMSVVKVPKDSKFNHLRKLLPKDFEWIKTRKRLAEESMIQHHCVWSYYDFINSDVSAIYSYYDKNCIYDEIPRRYTIEFKISKNKNGKTQYRIAQMHSAYNREPNEKLEKNIYEMLNSDNSKLKLVA